MKIDTTTCHNSHDKPVLEADWADWYIFKSSNCWKGRRVHFQEKPPNRAPDIPMSHRAHDALAVSGTLDAKVRVGVFC